MNSPVRPPTSPYAPPASDPVRLATVTMEAVDRIGTAAADEIERSADELEKGAAEIGKKLRELADAIRGNSKVASGHVTEFCEKSMAVLGTIREAQAKLAGDKTDGALREVEALAEDLRIPAFLRRERERLNGAGPGESRENPGRRQP